jgi:hypothetical protein
MYNSAGRKLANAKDDNKIAEFLREPIKAA